MREARALGLLLPLALAALGCADDGSGADADAGADGGSDTATTGAIELTGNWDGDKPDGVGFDVAVFACPFTMPPESFPTSPTIDTTTGDVYALVEDVPPGEWCVMAYIDMIPDDSLAPVSGVDALNATGQENEYGAIPVEVVAGETTALPLTFAVE